MDRPIVSLSMMTFGDADGFDAWFDEEPDATLLPPAVPFNAIVMSLLDTTPFAENAPAATGNVMPRLAA